MSDANNGGRDRRAMPRWAMGEEATIQSGGMLHRCRVSDISASGVGLQCEAELSVDDELSLRLYQIPPLPLRIVRVAPGFVGAAFVDGPHYLFR